jgi:hypothetical protein
MLLFNILFWRTGREVFEYAAFFAALAPPFLIFQHYNPSKFQHLGIETWTWLS